LSLNKQTYFIHDTLDNHIIENILQRQKILQNRIQKELNSDGKIATDCRIVIVLNNCFQENMLKNKIFKKLLTNARCWKITFIITTESIDTIPEDIYNMSHCLQI
jgi:hypothetical protein